METAHAWVPQVIFGWSPLWAATIALIITYAVVISERINRAIVALLGAGLMIVLGVLNQEAAIRGIDFNTIGLLVGMMMIVSITKRTGVFQYLAIWSAKKVKANPAGIMIMLQIVTAVASALLDNVTTVLLVVPVTLVITEELGVPPYPFLVTQIFASNIGGTATLVGDPPNILIGSQVGIPFNDFVTNLGPVVVLVLAVTIVWFHFLWGRRLHATPEARARVMSFNERDAIKDRRLLTKALGVLGGVMLAFILAHSIGLEPGTIGLFGAAVLMLLECAGLPAEEQARTVTETFNEVEWITIFFFVGLFVVVTGVEHAGLLRLLADQLVALTGGDLAVTAHAVTWASAVLSSIVDNIPFVATMIPLIKSMAPSFGGPEAVMPLWWALSLGACLGGNGTLVGASANLTVAGLAERAGVHFSFIRYTLVAYPVMLLSIVISTGYLYLRYLS